MSPAIVLVFALAGVLAGVALRPIVVRHCVPVGEAPRVACPACAARVGWHDRAALSEHCRSCGARIGPPALVLEVGLAVVFAALSSQHAQALVAVAWCWLAALGIAAATIDLAVHRLPNLLTAATWLGVTALLCVQSALEHDLGRWAAALLGGIGLAGFFLILAIASAGDLGLGDVKLAASIGTSLAWTSITRLALGTLLALILAASWATIAVLTHRIQRKEPIAFGPFLILGALLALLTQPG